MPQVGLTGSISLPPLLKWAGGKRFLTERLSRYVPPAYGRYIEPFFGGGALFFWLRPACALLSDTNKELVDAYTAIRDEPDRVIEVLRRWENSEIAYYRIRSYKPTSSHCRAARLLYLNTLSFNGIHRVNKRGEFNVPYGHKKWLPTCDRNRILTTSDALQGKKICCQDFQVSGESAQEGDFVYFDPPYTVAHSNNGFVKYNAEIFSWADQERLARLAERLRIRGCNVVVSNADHPSIADLYPNFSVQKIERFSVMAALAAHRKQITESIFYSQS